MKKMHRKVNADATAVEMGIPLIDTTSSQTIAKPNVICRAAFKGEVTNEQYDIVMKYIKDMQERGWTWVIAYTEGRNENLYIDYVVEKHGI
jgi:hypothetical protein